METITFARWIIQVDSSLTRDLYRSIPNGSPEDCRCDPCLNFVANRKQIYPAAAQELLAQLGIDWHKEAEIYNNGQIRPGIHLYGGWFHFVGNMQCGNDCWKSVGDKSYSADFHPVTDNFMLGFSNNIALLPDPFKGKDVVQVEFSVETTWIIDAPEVS